MSTSAKLLLLSAFLAAVCGQDARAEKQTVCTITVNSSDEKETFRRSLPADKYRFVELVERGRGDWLASACQQGVRCDVLVISGHYDGGNEFFSDKTGSREYLPVDEMERVSCSDSCPGLFSQLKEVYLFGCNTLNPAALKSASAEIGRSLLRSGHSRGDAERIARDLSDRHGESSRDRMRLVFKDVPVIYGFSSVAPLGPAAASILNHHFQSAGTAEVGSGRASAALLGRFAANSMVVASGMRDADQETAHRQDVCQFSDDRLTAAQTLGFVHELLGRDMAEVRMFLDRIEKAVASAAATEALDPETMRVRDEIAADATARMRFLDFARDADRPAIRVRMIALAGNLGWLAPAEQRAEVVRMIGDLLAQNAVSTSDVDLVCELNRDHDLDQERVRLEFQEGRYDEPAPAAILACLGSRRGHARLLRALTSPNDADVEVAQVYFRRRPIEDVNELRVAATGISKMTGLAAQIRALNTLANHRLSDPESLGEMTRLFPVAESVGVQTAIAGILIRADYRAMDKPELVQTLLRHRLKSSPGENLIDVLIRRLQAD